MRASSSVRGTALPWSGSEPPGQGSCQLAGRSRPPAGRGCARARAPSRPGRAGRARRSPAGSGRRRRSCRGGRRRRRRGRRRARRAPPRPRPPTRPGRRRPRGRRSRWGRRGGHAAQCPRSARAGQPNRGNAAACGPSSARSVVGQRLPAGAAAGGGDVVPAGGERRAEQALQHPADLGQRARRPGPGRSSRTHEVEVVDGGLDGERGEEVGHGQHPALGADQVVRSHPAGRHQRPPRTSRRSARRCPARPPCTLAAIRVLQSSSSSPGSGGRQARQ